MVGGEAGALLAAHQLVVLHTVRAGRQEIELHDPDIVPIPNPLEVSAMEMAPGGNCPQRPRYHCPGSASEALLAGRGGITPSPYSDGLEFPCRPFYFRVPIPWVPGQVALVRQMPCLSDVYMTLHHELHTLLARSERRLGNAWFSMLR